jgi:hypothetical protein
MGTGSHLVPPALERFAVIAVRRGVSLGALQSTNARDFAIVLAAAAQGLPVGGEFSEREVNERLRAFLADAGAMLGTDHVELRRWLVDFRLLQRDGYGRVYRVGKPVPEIADVALQLAGSDLAAVARAARDADATRRAERKERWQNAKRAADG